MEVTNVADKKLLSMFEAKADAIDVPFLVGTHRRSYQVISLFGCCVQYCRLSETNAGLGLQKIARGISCAFTMKVTFPPLRLSVQNLSEVGLKFVKQGRVGIYSSIQEGLLFNFPVFRG